MRKVWENIVTDVDILVESRPIYQHPWHYPSILPSHPVHIFYNIGLFWADWVKYISPLSWANNSNHGWLTYSKKKQLDLSDYFLALTVFSSCNGDVRLLENSLIGVMGIVIVMSNRHHRGCLTVCFNKFKVSQVSLSSWLGAEFVMTFELIALKCIA